MRKNHFRWAKEHQNWTHLNWRNFIFSDESKFNLFSATVCPTLEGEPVQGQLSESQPH